MKVNINKYDPLEKEKDEAIKRIGDTEIKNGAYKKLLGIKVDTKLNLKEHLNDITGIAWRY